MQRVVTWIAERGHHHVFVEAFSATVIAVPLLADTFGSVTVTAQVAVTVGSDSC